MSILADFRTSLAYKLLEKRQRQQTGAHHSVSFTDTGSIGILFHAHTLDDVAAVKEFTAYLKEQGKKVAVLGYVSAASETAFKTKSVFFDYFTEKDVNFLFIPSQARTGEFMEQPFDMLINFCVDECFPLNYLAAMSHATFRVGRYSSRQLPYLDLMIHLKEDRNIGNFALQLKQYLSLPASA